MVAAAVSAKYVFDLQPGDVYWCTADCGWVTGARSAHPCALPMLHATACWCCKRLRPGRDLPVYRGACKVMPPAANGTGYLQALTSALHAVAAAGHTYLTYGPLLVGAQTVVFEGVPVHPTPARCWQIVEKYKVRCSLVHAPTQACSLQHALLLPPRAVYLWQWSSARAERAQRASDRRRCSRRRQEAVGHGQGCVSEVLAL